MVCRSFANRDISPTSFLTGPLPLWKGLNGEWWLEASGMDLPRVRSRPAMRRYPSTGTRQAGRDRPAPALSRVPGPLPPPGRTRALGTIPPRLDETHTWKETRHGAPELVELELGVSRRARRQDRLGGPDHPHRCGRKGFRPGQPERPYFPDQHRPRTHRRGTLDHRARLGLRL